MGSDLAEFRWADGISYAGSDGLVAGNLVVDATDGAIGGLPRIETVLIGS